MMKTANLRRRLLGVVVTMSVFLLITVTSYAQTAPPILADFEDGVPADWFQYSNIVTPNVITDTITGSQLLSVTYDVVGAGFGGFGALLSGQNWSDYDAVSFDFYGTASGETYTFEVQDGAGAVVERFHGTFVDDMAGWQTVVIPFSSFKRSTIFQDAGAPDDGFQIDSVAAWVFPLPVTAGSFQLDNIAITNIIPFADFDTDFPEEWFQYGSVVTPIVADGVLTGTYDIAGGADGFGGFGAGFTPSQDWSELDGITYLMYGYNSGETFTFEIQDGTAGAGVERFVHTVVDDFDGWMRIVAPFDSFVRSTGFQEDGAPDDGLNLVDVRAWAFPLPNAAGAITFDDFSIYGDEGNVTLRVSVESATISIAEGGTAIVTVTLSAVSTETVTVEYGTSDGTAVDGVDYTAESGTLTFAPGETTQSFMVTTIDNDTNEDNRTVTITLTNTVNAELGGINSATLTIVDDELNLPPTGGKTLLLDDFTDDPLASGTDADGNPVGYEFFAGGSSTVAIEIAVPPEPRPGADTTDVAMAETLFITAGSFSGFTQKLTNDAADAWTPQDWTSSSGISFWLYGNNSGGVIFMDVLDNRNPDSTTDDAERFVFNIPDNFSGWQYFEINWTQFTRKDIGNGAPNDGLNLDEVHGYAFGGFGEQPMDATYYIDEVRLIQITDSVEDFSGALPSGADADTNPIGYYDVAGGGGAINYMTATAPTAIPGFDDTNTALQLDMTLPTNAFAVAVNAFGNDAMDTWTPQDWSNYEGICFWMYGNNTGGILFVDVLDNRNPDSVVDDAERFSIDIPDDFSGWQFFQYTWDELNRKDIGNGAPNDGFDLTEIHGFAFGGFGSVDMGTNTYYVDELSVWGDSGADDPLTIQYERSTYEVVEGENATLTIELSRPSTEDVVVSYSTAESFGIPFRDFIPVSGTATIPGSDIVLGTIVIPAGQLTTTVTIETIDNEKDDVRNRNIMVVLYDADGSGAELGFQQQTVLIITDNDDANPNIFDDIELFHRYQTVGDVTLNVTEMMTGDADAIPGQGMFEQSLAVTFDSTAETMCLDRMFTEPQNWTEANSITFWFNGTNSGEQYTVQIHDNGVGTTADTPSADWVLAWSDEFDDSAGTPPDPNVWMHEIGDGSLNEIPGWGNSEFQYYTDDPANASTDGEGNMVITLRELDDTTDLVCYYGQCDYTSARLITQDRMEFEYGRIEARIQVPDGEAGLWPAFWSLGTDIREVQWPQTGEIDIMEYVSRNPNEIFGTIHGPGYSGGAAFGNTQSFTDPVAADYHTYTIEWTPDNIIWYVDDIQYHEAVPADVAPNDWVFNHPFFLLMNMAVGGNFGGTISDELTFPQEMLVDYVRVYQAPGTAERFEATFTDDEEGWQQVTIPFSLFDRSADQPAGAPNDGLTLSAVEGYSIKADGVVGSFSIDQVGITEALPTAVAQNNVAVTNNVDIVLYMIVGAVAIALITVLYAKRKQTG